MFDRKQDPSDGGLGGALEPIGPDRTPVARGREAWSPATEFAAAAPAEGGGSALRDFDVSRLLHSLYKHRRLVAVATVAGLLLALATTLMTTPSYRAQATIQIDKETITVVKVEGFQPSSEGGADREFLQTHYELLSSRTLAEHVVTNLGLIEDKTFQAAEGTGLIATVKRLFVGQSEAEIAESARRRQNGLIKTLQDHLVIEPVRNSRLVKIGYDHPDADVAQRVADGFAKTFIADNLERKYAASGYARTFLEERLQQLKARLEENEKELGAYAQDQGIVNLDNNSTLLGGNLEAMNANLAKARDDRIKLETMWREAETSEGYALTQVQDSRTIQENRIKRDELAAQYQEKLNLFKPGFPEMVQLKARIDEFDRLIQQQIRAVKDAIFRDYRAAAAREEKLVAEMAGLEKSMLDLRNRSIRYNILKREVDTTKQLYDGLLQRYKEIGVAGGVGTNNISLIDPAVRPEKPRTPRVTLNLALGLIGGLLLGMGGALAIEYFDNRFKSPEDVEHTLGLPVLGIIPKSEGGAFDQVMADPRSPVAEAYRSLRTSIQFSTSTGTPPTIFVTSTKPAEGKSTTAAALATNFTQLGLKVLLIDGDLRKPSLHKKLSLPNEAGLSNYLVGSGSLTEIIQRSDNALMHVMTTGPLPPNPAELLASTKMVELLSLVSRVFDVVVIDGPPLMGLADAVIMSSQVSASILVVAANDGRREAAVVALRRMRAARAHVIGAVLTKFDQTQVGYGYGYGYGYGDYYAYGHDHTHDHGRLHTEKRPELT